MKTGITFIHSDKNIIFTRLKLEIKRKEVSSPYLPPASVHHQTIIIS